jgi:hypothetical protein
MAVYEVLGPLNSGFIARALKAIGRPANVTRLIDRK